MVVQHNLRAKNQLGSGGAKNDLEVIREMAKNLLDVREIKQLLLMKRCNKSLED